MKKHTSYAGLDQHHKMTKVIVIDPEDQIKQEATIQHESKDQVKEELKRILPAGCLVALEATGFWYWMVDLLDELGYESILVHSMEVAEIAKSRKKNDKRDAFILAKLAKDGRIHRAYKMPKEIRPIRDLLRDRMDLVNQKTSNKNQIHSVLHKHGIWHNFSDVFGKQGSEFLNSLQFDEPFKKIMENHNYIIQQLLLRIDQTEQMIKSLVKKDEVIKRLTTIPGIGPVIARVIRYEIWDIGRFESFKEFKSYVGIAPSTLQSADTVHQGGITHQGNTYVRWAVVEAAQRVLPHDEYLRRKYYRLRKHKGGGKARVAIANDLLQAVYFVWRRNESYRPKPIVKYKIIPSNKIAVNQ